MIGGLRRQAGLSLLVHAEFDWRSIAREVAVEWGFWVLAPGYPSSSGMAKGVMVTDGPLTSGAKGLSSRKTKWRATGRTGDDFGQRFSFRRPLQFRSIAKVLGDLVLNFL